MPGVSMATTGLDADDFGWLPRTLLDLLASDAATDPPAGARFEAVVLVADVSGFTALTERMAESEPAGAERLSEIFNARFGALIDTIARHGGDITHFAGDAIVAVWQPDASAARSLVAAVTRAAACALDIQALPLLASAAQATLRVRAGVATMRGPASPRERAPGRRARCGFSDLPAGPAAARRR